MKRILFYLFMIIMVAPTVKSCMGNPEFASYEECESWAISLDDRHIPTTEQIREICSVALNVKE